MEDLLATLSSVTLSTIWNYIIEFGMSVIVALLILLIGRKLIKWTMKLYDRFVENSQIDKAVSIFVRKVVAIALYVLLVVLVIDYIGFETSSIMAAIGSAGLAIGLALQGSLSNFAGGVILLVLKPFKEGDFITTSGVSGKVQSVDIFYTRLLTGDNKLVVIPNGTLSNSEIENSSHMEKRRLDVTIGVEYSIDYDKVKATLEKIVSEHTMVIPGEEITIYISSFDESCITFGLRVWVPTGDYWNAKFEMMERIKKTFDEEGIVIPFNQLDVNVVNMIQK